MASSDAKPFVTRGQLSRIYIRLKLNSGAPLIGAAGLDSEISKDGAAFVDCVNEAVEIGQGLYYLELTAAETTADYVGIVVKSTTANALQAEIDIYPVEPGDTNAWIDDALRRDISAVASMPPGTVRTLRLALAWLSNRKDFNTGANTGTLYSEDDTTALTTFSTTSSPAASTDVVTSINPA
jgi:hypothetical protein